MMNELNPGLLIIAGALLVPFIPGRVLRGAYMLALPVAVFIYLLGLPMGSLGQFELFDMTLTTLRIDKLSLVFGYIFLLATFLGVIYALHVGDWVQHTTGLMYAGAAIGAVFAGDLITLFIYWELTAITSVFLIWAAGTPSALDAGMRYLIIQVASGVILLAGIAFYYHETGGIAFNAIGIESLAGQIILVAFGIKCAFPLLNNWLQDSYPEATITGTVMLSAFTTKMAVYTLARGYAGTDILIPIGAIMAVYMVFHALVENDLRRVLAYSLNSQLGFMVVGVGIGTEMALNGTAAHAVASVLYKALLFMAVGAVMFRTGTAKATELGGLYRSMPWTTVFCLVGAASIAAMPLFSGFVTKSLLISATMKGGYFWAWLALLAAGAGAVLHSSIRVPYYAFFGSKRNEGSGETPPNMLVAMAISAACCIAIGIFPAPFYALLPFPIDYVPYTFDHVITQLQLVAFAALAFAVLMRTSLYPPELKATNLDTDWFYRRLGYNIGATLLLMGGDAVQFISSRGSDAFHFLERRLHYHHNPEGLLGRTLPTGSMAFWATVMLGGYLLVFYFR